MQKYIHSVVKDILEKSVDLKEVLIILPSKRASVFVKKEFKNQLTQFQFLPHIISIEEFIFKISKISSVDSLNLLFEFYNIYKNNIQNDELESFEDFSKWASILIKDFNEIDSYLINQQNIFGYLKDISRIESWFKNQNKSTELTNRYIQFFEKIELYYAQFYQHLKEKQIGYQGLQYREAHFRLEEYIQNNDKIHHVFVGFNALNTAEIQIITTLLNNQLATIYFDLDETLLNEGISATKFIKTYKEQWKYFKQNNFQQITNEFKSEKTITVIGVPKNVSQIKYASELISDNQDAALVLANENLLTTTINSLPNAIEKINITMGLPLQNIIYADLFNVLFKLHLNKNKIGKRTHFYYKDVISILNHPSLKNIFININTNELINKNLIFIDETTIHNLYNHKASVGEFLNVIFSNWNENTLEHEINLISLLKEYTENPLEIEYLTRFEQLFNQISNLNNEYQFIENLESLYAVYQQILSTETLSFKGDAINGLQIMGMLETRVLSFDTVIITSVNEGFLPSGKSNNSFIPFDVKREKGIPTYQEKDAIFSYHFFRLIARAKKVFLLYNTETDDFGSGEKSRFITQLELLKDKLPNLQINEYIVSPKVETKPNELQQIIKNNDVLEALFKANIKGFSPTALTNYIYNPIAFYKQKILRIYQLNEVEETIAANTLGTVIHKVLEDFYTPFKGEFIKVADIKPLKKQVAVHTKTVFKEVYKNGDISKGKNLLVFEITKQYIQNFLNQEIALLAKGVQLKIIDLEVDLTTNINIEGFDIPIKLMGQADRIDEINGVLRIIDYKTGKVEQKSLDLVNSKKNEWHLVAQDHKYSKAFQVLLYAYMYVKTHHISLENKKIESGIISFKNLKAGFMKVNRSPISIGDMNLFEEKLSYLLSEIFDIEEAFVENENLPY